MENKPKFKPNPKLKLMDQVRQVLRYHHDSYRTEQTSCDWIIRFVKFQGYQKHPKDMGKSKIEAFLSHHVFPAKKLSKDPRSDTLRMHHVLESGLKKAVKIAVDRAGITKRIGEVEGQIFAVCCPNPILVISAAASETQDFLIFFFDIDVNA